MTTGCPEDGRPRAADGFSELNPLSFLTSWEDIGTFLEEADKEWGNPRAAEYLADCYRIAADALDALAARDE